MLSNARFLPLGLEATRLREGALAVHSPIDGSLLARLAPQDAAATDAAIACSVAAFLAWRNTPAPRRGELVRRFGARRCAHKAALAELVTLEAGKIRSEGEGEVQEMIDICDFAVGLSRQLHGLTIASERPGHRMREQLAPARAGGRDQRLQLPGGGVGLERSAGAGVRRQRGVEAQREDAADGTRHAGVARQAALRDFRAEVPRRDHRAGAPRPGAGGRGARRRRACGLAVGHRQLRMGRAVGPRWRHASAAACSSSAATTP
jgi:hypothetical protein